MNTSEDTLVRRMIKAKAVSPYAVDPGFSKSSLTLLLTGFFDQEWRVLEKPKEATVVIKLQQPVSMGALMQFNDTVEKIRTFGITVKLDKLSWFDKIFCKQWSLK